MDSVKKIRYSLYFLVILKHILFSSIKLQNACICIFLIFPQVKPKHKTALLSNKVVQRRHVVSH